MILANDPPFQDIEPREAEKLIRANSVRILDVRTPEEYGRIGYIPGAVLLPVDWIAVAPATLEPKGRPILVYCEHGIRSTMAASFLARAGFEEVLNLKGGLTTWKGPREFTGGDPSLAAGPSSWLVENIDLLPTGGQVLDVACGKGRHALLLAAAGFPVRAVDRDPEKIESLQRLARRLDLDLTTEVVDLEMRNIDLGTDRYDLILVFNYLHRPLFPPLMRALKSGGRLFYETFLTAQAHRGKPTNPDYLLHAGELEDRVAPLEVLRRREGEFEGRMISAVVARKVEAARDTRWRPSTRGMNR